MLLSVAMVVPPLTVVGLEDGCHQHCLVRILVVVVVVLHALLLLHVLMLVLDCCMLLLPTFSLPFTFYLASSKSLLPPSYPNADRSLYPMHPCSYF
jgi:hypothetical protein